MKKYLLPETGFFYKANLHSHSTVSDGAWTPEEIKERYMEKGYSIVAYTDHSRFYSYNHLTDDNFLALNGIEYGVNNMAITGNPERKFRKNCDICMIALEPEGVSRYDHVNPDFVFRYTPESVNELIEGGRKCNFFVTHNHPTWSGEEYTDYIQYNNMHAMEICNYGCVCSGFDEHNSRIYNDMLKSGKRLYCIATDDNHNKPGQPLDSFGGFTMIKAEKLEYRTVTKALLDGNFYASEGPLIEELYYEDGKVYIKTSPAQEIFITKPGKNVGKVKEDGKLICEGAFTIEDNDGYFFITVVDETGKKAYTNAYFLDDILKNI